MDAVDDVGTACIEGEGSRTRGGYLGKWIYIGRNATVHMAAHRVAFEQAWGVQIPPGMLIRHSCDNPPCVNPLHLMLGTTAENMADMTTRGRHGMSRRTHCPRGHELVEGNLVASKAAQGWRECLICRREINRRYELRRKSAA